MKTITLVLFSFLSLSIFAQKNSVKEIISEFEGKEGVTTLIVSTDMLHFISEAKTDDTELSDLFKGITEVKILVLNKAPQLQKDLFESMVKMLSMVDYKELMTIQDGKKTVKMIFKKSDGKITNFLLLVTGDKEPVLINITGIIDTKKISKIGKKLNMTGCEYLAKLDKK